MFFYNAVMEYLHTNPEENSLGILFSAQMSLSATTLPVHTAARPEPPVTGVGRKE